jgi:hypothetical protein
MMNWKGYGKNMTQPNSRNYSSIFLEGLWKPVRTSVRINGLKAKI